MEHPKLTCDWDKNYYERELARAAREQAAAIPLALTHIKQAQQLLAVARRSTTPTYYKLTAVAETLARMANRPAGEQKEKAQTHKLIKQEIRK